MQPTSVIKARLGIEPNGRVQRYFQKRCKDYMDKYVPREDGNLRKNVDLSNPNLIVYQSPYAHYMYEGKVMGPNIPITENGNIIGWFSPKGKRKHYNHSSQRCSRGKHTLQHNGGLRNCS